MRSTNKKKITIRLDLAILERGLAESRQKAQALIMSGRVSVNGKMVDKPGYRIKEEDEIEVKEPDRPYVSRGGLKLEAALKYFGIDVTGQVAMDVGASTGGFTDCLLRNGAKRVYAIDVGRGQLHWKLRNDERVICMEGTNIRYLDKSRISEPVQLAVADTSFISLEKVLPKVMEIVENGGTVIALIKPQFEVGREKVSKGGVVKDPVARREAIDKIAKFSRSIGFEVLGVTESPLRGPKGNIEYFICLRK